MTTSRFEIVKQFSDSISEKQWENAKATISPDTLTALNEVLNAPEEELEARVVHFRRAIKKTPFDAIKLLGIINSNQKKLLEQF